MTFYQICNKMVSEDQIQNVFPIEEMKDNGDHAFQFTVILKNKEMLIYSRHFETTQRLLIRLEMEELYLNIKKTILAKS